LLDELKDDDEHRVILVRVLTALLAAHSRAEETEVYPVAASEAGTKVDVLHGQLEHIEVEELLAKLRRTNPASVGFEEVLRN
jgi:hypothetical protein